jgi:hypothetical protein
MTQDYTIDPVAVTEVILIVGIILFVGRAAWRRELRQSGQPARQRQIDMFPAYAVKRRLGAILWWLCIGIPVLWTWACYDEAMSYAHRWRVHDVADVYVMSQTDMVALAAMWLLGLLPLCILIISSWVRYGRWSLGPWTKF